GAAALDHARYRRISHSYDSNSGSRVTAGQAYGVRCIRSRAGKKSLHFAPCLVLNVGKFSRHAAAKASRPSRIGDLRAEEVEDREVLFIGFDVRDVWSGVEHDSCAVDAISVDSRTPAAPEVTHFRVRERLTTLRNPRKDGRERGPRPVRHRLGG